MLWVLKQNLLVRMLHEPPAVAGLAPSPRLPYNARAVIPSEHSGWLIADHYTP